MNPYEDRTTEDLPCGNWSGQEQQPAKGASADQRGKTMQQAGQVIHLRPHHGLCLQNFRGNGYSNEFSRNMARMKEFLRAHPEVTIAVTKGADDLCGKCPNRRGNACESEHPPLFDGNVLKAAGLSYGQRLSWAQLRDRTRELSLDHLDEICPGCEWLELCHQIAKERRRGDSDQGPDRGSDSAGE